jgi:hypothetical protein
MVTEQPASVRTASAWPWGPGSAFGLGLPLSGRECVYS